MMKVDMKEREKTIIEQYNGIFPVYEAFYLAAIVYSAGCAIEAFDRYKIAVENRYDNDAAVSYIHEALTHTAAVSRFFWPMSKRAISQKRAERLRTTFRINNESPLYARELRNALEHFDERLDEYLLHDLTGHIFPTPLVEASVMDDEEIGPVFRLVDPEAEIFVIFGKRYSFGAIREAITSVYRLARDYFENDGRLPFIGNEPS